MANKYLRQGASGSGNGNDWANAYTTGTALRDGLTRGDTGYIADGSYSGSVEWNHTESSTTVITIKKATIADHGTSTGWVDTYGDGQAVFSGAFQFSHDYYVIDGQTRNASNWMDDTAYGLAIRGGIYIQTINFPPGGDHIAVYYCDLGPSYSQSTVDLNEAVYLGGFGGHTILDITINHCFLHNSSFIQIAGADGLLIEYNAFAAGWAKEAIRGQGTAKNGIIRYNTFYNASQKDPDDPTSGTTADIAMWDGDGAGSMDNWEIYGNIIWNDITIPHSGGTILMGGGSWSGNIGPLVNNVVVYNNTMVGIDNTAVIIVDGGTGNVATNNLWYNCTGTPTASANTTATNGETATDIFVSVAGGDFRLSQESAAGTSLSSPYNVDMDGVTRGVSGNFSRGAFQFVDTADVNLIVTNLTCTTMTVG